MKTEFITTIVAAACFAAAFIIKKSDRVKKSVTKLFVVRLIMIGAVIVAAFAMLSAIPGFERSWNTMLAGSGIAAVILGLAAQSTLANVFAGIAISSVSRPFDIGDRVKIGDVTPGFVKNITLRHVELTTYMGQTIFIPNSTVQSSIIVNYTKEDGNAYPLEITISYESDINRAVKIFEDVVNDHPLHYGTTCTVLIKEAGDYGIKLKGTVMTKDFMDTTVVCSDCLKEIMKRYKENDIDIPYPTYDIRDIQQH